MGILAVHCTIILTFFIIKIEKELSLQRQSSQTGATITKDKNKEILVTWRNAYNIIVKTYIVSFQLN